MKNLKFKLYTLSIFAIFAILFIGSATSKEPMLTPNFNWSAAASAQPGSANVTVGLIQPDYIINWGGQIPEPFYSYRKSLEDDFLELLTEKGYTVRGPYASRDEMVFSDKEACDIILNVEVDPIFKTVAGGWRAQLIKCGTEYYYKYVGTLAMYGKINLVASEPISGEKVWSKSVELPEANTGELKSKYMVCGGAGSLLDLIRQDATVANPMTSMLQTNYSEVLDKCDKLVEPVEFQRLKPQIQKLKSK